jgi:hypothetical protein
MRLDDWRHVMDPTESNLLRSKVSKIVYGFLALHLVPLSCYFLFRGVTPEELASPAALPIIMAMVSVPYLYVIGAGFFMKK